MFNKQLVILLFSCCLLSCATTEEGNEGPGSGVSNNRMDCIFRSSVRGYSVLDDSNLVISGPGRKKYHMVLFRRARGIDSSWGISFDSRDSRICPGFSDVVFDNGIGGESIRISSIRGISPEEHNDLLIQFGKREPEIQQTPAPNAVKGAEVEELDTAASDE